MTIINNTDQYTERLIKLYSKELSYIKQDIEVICFDSCKMTVYTSKDLKPCILMIVDDNP